MKFKFDPVRLLQVWIWFLIFCCRALWVTEYDYLDFVHCMCLFYTFFCILCVVHCALGLGIVHHRNVHYYVVHCALGLGIMHHRNVHYYYYQLMPGYKNYRKSGMNKEMSIEVYRKQSSWKVWITALKECTHETPNVKMLSKLVTVTV